MMLVEFVEEFGVSREEAYEYFRTPLHWPHLFKAFGGENPAFQSE